jgi:hypothetical protein
MWRLVPERAQSRGWSDRPEIPADRDPSASYSQRAEWNVRDTGGTVILSIEHELTGGSRKTAEFAVKHNKPYLHVHPGQKDAAQALRDFVAGNEIATLNIAGPRASEKPQVGKFVKESWRRHFRLDRKSIQTNTYYVSLTPKAL